MNESDVVNRLITFPPEWLVKSTWIKKLPDQSSYIEKLEIIANDFLLGGENTLGMNKKPITSAKPLLIS